MQPNNETERSVIDTTTTTTTTTTQGCVAEAAATRGSTGEAKP
jgi:hypothetical protein